MSLLELARVLVIDDKPDEVAGLLDALREEGVWAVYINPHSSENINPVPLRGVRIVFLDLHLELPGQDPVLTAVAQLEQWVAAGELYVVILWTGYPKDGEQLKEEIEKRKSHGTEGTFAGLIGIHMMPNKNASVDEIRKGIVSILEQQAAPFGVLLCWEQNVNAAAAMAVQDIPRTGQATPSANLEQALNCLGNAVRGKDWPSGDPWQDYQAMASGLTSVFVDYLEQEFTQKVPDKRIVRKVAGSTASIDEQMKARINKHLIVRNAGEEKLAPGAVVKTFGWCSPYPFDSEKIVRDIFGRDADPRALQAHAAPVLVEITPLCDFVQKKHCGQHRFVGGILLGGWKTDKKGIYVKPSGSQGSGKIRPKSADFLKEIGPFCLPADPAKVVLLVLDAHFLFACSEKNCRWKPAFFLRTQVLSDVLAWFGRQASRPGVFSAG